MKTVFDRSFGVIPLSQVEGKWRVFLVQHQHGDHWGFPKGHKHSRREPDQQAAARELQEETSLQVSQWLPIDAIEERYSYQKNPQTLVKKSVLYFLALVEGEIGLQENEISQGKWCSLELASATLTFNEDKNVLQLARKALGRREGLADGHQTDG